MTKNLLDGYIDRAALAKELACSPRTIARYENMPDGLPSLTLAGRRLYRREAVAAFLAAREKRPNPRRNGRGAKHIDAGARP